jgi:hypothetical protein
MAPEKRLALDQVGWQFMTNFTALPAATNQLTLTADYTSVIDVGFPLRYEIASTRYYGVVKTITSSLLTIRGAPFQMGTPVDNIAFGPAEKAIQLEMLAASTYGDAVRTNVLDVKSKLQEYWHLPEAALVGFSYRHDENAGSTQPRINVLVNGNSVSTTNGGAGVNPSTTLQYNPDVDINTTNYIVPADARIEIECSVAGSPTSGAKYLMVIATLVCK